MNLSVNLIKVRWKLLIALHVILFLCDVAWAHAPLNTLPPGKSGAASAGVNAGGSAYLENLSPAFEAAQCTLPGASIATPVTLTCTRMSITLSASATAPSVTYLWAGPNGYASALQNPVVSLPGTYNLTVTNTAGGCTSTASVEVIQDIALPGATASVSHAIDCANPTVNLQATTSITGATFRWIGTNFVSLVQNPAITVAGGYTLNVTNPNNGCTSTATVNVTQSITKPGVTPFVSGPITCTTTEVQLDASSPEAEALFSWTGPNGYTDNTQNPLVSVEGVYTAKATNPLNSCFSTANITVLKTVTEPGATITPSGQITCTSGSVTLYGSSPTTDVTYSWTGPPPFVPTAVQNPTASIAGNYMLTVTKVSNGCTSQANYTVVVNNTRPGATAGVSGQLNCTNTSVTLQGNSPTTGTTLNYRWIGPAGSGFPSTAQNPVTSTRGGYTLTVTNPANGCTSNAVVSVIQSITAPQNVAIVAPEVLTCTRQSVALVGSSTTSGVNYLWTGPGPITGENTNSATVNQPGEYTLRVTNPVNNCSVTLPVTVLQNITAPEQVTIDAPLVLTCTRQSVNLVGHSSTASVVYLWTGPGPITGADAATASVTQPGEYTLKVTNPVNNCFTTLNVTVLQNLHAPEDVTIDAPLVLTCTRQSVNLVGNSSTASATYLWTGLSPITNATAATASVTQPGEYTLTVTDPVSGCTTIRTVTVIQNITAPQNVTIDAPLVLTCTRQSVNLVGHTSTANVAYLWTGPGPITNENAATASVTEPGEYTLKVTDLVNNCFTTLAVTVIQNITAPQNVTIDAPLVLTCTRQTVNLVSHSGTGNVSYAWSGPGPITGTSAATASVTQPGEYTLVVTDNVNGCTTTVKVVVDQNITLPGVSILTPAKFTCNVSQVTLTATSGVTNLSYAWSGPGNFSSAVFNPIVTTSGTYDVIVTNPVNGCTSTASVTTLEDKAQPGVDASVFGTLTCSFTAVFLEGNSIPNAQYSWSGPEGYTSAEQNPTTAFPGLYTVIATNPANGCTSEDEVLVSQDITKPTGVLASASGDITCDQPTITLFGDPSTAGLSYAWTGPNDFSSPDQNPEAFDPGIYVLEVTKNSNGCKEESRVTVIENTTAPEGVAANVSSELTCDIQSVTLTGVSSTAGVTYSWSGPGAVTVLTPETASVSTAGTYQLTVHNGTNGCSSTANVTVGQNRTLPGVTASVLNNQKLTCSVTSVTLQAQSVAGATYSWTGPNGYSNNLQNPAAILAGVYTVEAKDPNNGCVSSADVTVEQDIQAPQNVTAVYSGTGIITCDQPSISITGASSTGGVTYSWSGDGTVTNPLQATASVATPGLYTVTVTNTANSCTASAGVTVGRNIEVPQNITITAPSGLLINCPTPVVSLNASTSTSNVTYTWTGSGTFTNPTPATAAVTTAGTFHLVVKNNANGCTASPADVTVTSNTTATTANITSPDGLSLTCFTAAVRLNGSGTPAGAISYRWTGPSGFTALTQNISVSVPGDYTVTTTHNVSGCTRSTTRTVTPSFTTVTVSANASGVLNCTNQSINLEATGISGTVEYLWTGPGPITNATAKIATVTTPGIYTVSVRTPGNCTASTTINATGDFSEPEALSYTADGTLNECGTTEGVVLTGNSSTDGALYKWTFPDGSEVPDQQTLTLSPGLYTLTVTHPNSNCSEELQVELIAEPCLEMAAVNNTVELKNIENAFTVGVYPNPATDKASIEFTPDGNYNATVEVYTLLNVKVATPYMGEVSAGKTYTAVFDSGNHRNGVYIYRIVYGSGRTKEGRFVVMH